MKRGAHKPPSRVNYEANHPTVSIRVTRELYDQLGELRRKSGKSLGDILREAVGKQGPSTKKAYDNGFFAAKSQFTVTYKCSVCGGSLVINSDKEKKAAADYMREHGWAHSSCLGKTNR